ncbi:saccharopine dehydrogenase family protein [Flavobacterium acetivorans]|uniref:saccharopine dehydrogenase family protein n=1 Tax=Flavobacterium acetivorans TaxID=2893883 RepID=UPI001E3B68C7|nr:saccharopine dehydrogenase C-terminal domain-containing protein [Flavobacterium sp. F-29]UFH34736.1 saccharopine dehydrogenase NADP-binding domain-containing protein [Flavobacterium sp. F-29]
MKKHYNIIIAGAGGIAEAVALLLNEWSELTPTIFIGDRNLSKAQNVAQWIQEGTTKPSFIKAYHLPENGISDEMKAIFDQGNIILDCLPGSQAPRIAQFAKEYELHYANLTEYVSETEKIMTLAKTAKTAFILQTGLAPGYIDLLAHGLFQQFCNDFKVNTVDKLELKVGALTMHAVAPHFYGFTWSPVGVATEYLKDTIVLRNYIKTTLPSLSERATIIIEGIAYEEDLTSGGAADLPDALIGKVNSLSYKTLRFPGHYAWVEEQISNFEHSSDRIKQLQQKMESVIPHIEDDQIVLYAAVEGKDAEGVLRRREIAKRILSLKVGKNQLRAIQTTTAAPLAQAAQLLLEGNYSGILLQSQIDPFLFLNGKFITNVYGKF